jgi:hypothetical protein
MVYCLHISLHLALILPAVKTSSSAMNVALFESTPSLTVFLPLLKRFPFPFRDLCFSIVTDVSS